MAKAINRSGVTNVYPDQSGPDRIVRTSDDPEAPEVYIDGAVELMAGPFTSRIIFHVLQRVTPDEAGRKPVETRRVALRLILPTSALGEIAAICTAGLVQNADQLKAGLEGLKQNIAELQTLNAKLPSPNVQR